MKKILMAIMSAGLLLCSCTLDNGTSSGHTAANMEKYIKKMFVNHVVYPAGAVNMLVSLDQYISATDEERKSDAFKWHRETIFHEDDVTFMIWGFGSVCTYGKSLFDSDSEWKIDNGIRFVRVSGNCWKVGQSSCNGAEVISTVVYEGQNEDGENVFYVEAYNTIERGIPMHSDVIVTAVLATAEGCMTVTNPHPIFCSEFEYFNCDFPVGCGVFRIETDINGKPQDWAELRYAESGKALFFKSNLR